MYDYLNAAEQEKNIVDITVKSVLGIAYDIALDKIFPEWIGYELIVDEYCGQLQFLDNMKHKYGVH